MTRDEGERLKSWENMIREPAFRRKGPKMGIQVSLLLHLLLMESQAVSQTGETENRGLSWPLLVWSVGKMTDGGHYPKYYITIRLPAVRPHNHIIHYFLPVVPPNLSASWLHTCAPDIYLRFAFLSHRFLFLLKYLIRTIQSTYKSIYHAVLRPKLDLIPPKMIASCLRPARIRNDFPKN